MASQVRKLQFSKVPLAKAINRGWSIFKRLIFPVETTDYQVWRRQFMLERLHLATWIALLCFLTLVGSSFYVIFFNFSQYSADLARVSGDSTLADRARDMTIASSLVMGLLILTCLLVQRIRWAQRHPAVVFLGLSWSITMAEQIVATCFRLPTSPSWTLELLGQAILIPVCWRLHLLAQLLPTAYYAIVNPLLGITHLGNRSLYDAYAIGAVVNLFWVCLICDLAVYLYERLKRSEFESQRQLRVFLHSVSHDLKTPVLGTSIVLNNLLKRPEAQLQIDRSVLERLLQGNERQLTLINSLLEAHNTEVQGIHLNCQPVQLVSLIGDVIADLAPVLNQHQIQLDNRVVDHLPMIYADANQLWRVYCNLITNALKHNPHGITLTLDASLVTDANSPVTAPTPHQSDLRWLCCTVQDNGIGIDRAQSQRLFELYARGARSRYMPGLGLGLYLCKQIVMAHGGEIGVVSDRGEGATFWFTLPIQ